MLVGTPSLLIVGTIFLRDTERMSNIETDLIESVRLQYSGFDPIAKAGELKMPDAAVRMGIALLCGKSAVDAYLASGRNGDPKSNTFRSAASKAARTKKMRAFINAAKEHRPEKIDLTIEEALSLLSRHARSENPTTSVRAIIEFVRIKREMSAPDGGWYAPGDPAVTLAEIEAEFGAEIAQALAAQVQH